MQNKQALKENIELVGTFRVITQAYQEISIMRMQKIRKSVLQTREFLTNLASIFYDVKHSRNRFIQMLIAADEEEEISPYSLLPQNGKKLAVYFSANEKMNGTIISKVFYSFADFIRKNKDYDIAIVGRIGKELYLQFHDLPRNFAYLEVPDENLKLEHVKGVVEKMISYQEVTVFYGKFQNIIMQDAATSNITGDKPFDSNIFKEPTDQVQRKFLYEPSVEDINNFFETQIFSALLKQTIDESHLARYASRVTAMEEAMANIDAKTKALRAEERKLKKSIQNKKQNEALAGMSLW